MVNIEELTKRYYTIGEVAEMFSETSSVIRYWENNVPKLNAHKDSRGTRRFTKKHIQQIQKLHLLIKDKGYTLEGAIQAMEHEDEKLQLKNSTISKLLEIKEGIKNLKASLTD